MTPLLRRDRAVLLAAPPLALWAWAVMPGGALLWATVGLGAALLALAAIDLRCWLLPDALTLPLVAAGIAVAAVAGADPLDHALGAAAGYASLAAVRALYRRLRRRDGLGGGDVKLFAAAGAWVTAAGLPTVLLVAGLAGLAVAAAAVAAGRRAEAAMAIPFGPCLALGTWVVWLHGPLLIG
ncbi:prepilin peptidase [Azospirillum sp. ST 5-10]|uniref:prepilin peptidase n=1 Tax=unclassified Azospirillum TaxID=2630922 RepID=UPI003F49BD47